MDHIIGIDLGTTNCCVAIVENDKPRVLEDDKGYTIQPSYVAVLGKNKYTVGHAAKAQAISKPTQTLHGIKRIIGRRFDSPEVEETRKRVSFEIIQGSKLDAEVRANGQILSPSAVSGILLGNMREIASRALGSEVSKAVVTVPAYFNHAQRKATIQAGDSAGLEIVRLLNEPTAAALAYGFRKQIDDKILVFDLGGGTFDVSILEVGGDVYEVLATNGDSFLGGDDFDAAVVQYLIDHFRQSKGTDLRDDKMAMQRLKDAAESAKCELSFTETAQIRLPNISGRDGLSLELNRAQLEELVSPLVERCMKVVLKTLEEAKLEANQVDEVLLVGGQPRMPGIQKRITELFKKAPCKGVHPDEAIATGAAIQAASLGGSTSGLLLLDVTPFSLGIDSAGDIFSTVVQKNATVPVSGRRTFTTVRENQTEVRIVVRQGESRRASENSLLGEFVLQGIREAGRMEPKIDVTFRIDSNGILHVVAKDQDTGDHQSISIHDYPELAKTGKGKEPGDVAGSDAEVAVAEGKKGGLFSRLAKGLRFGRSKAPKEEVAAQGDEAGEALDEQIEAEQEALDAAAASQQAQAEPTPQPEVVPEVEEDLSANALAADDEVLTEDIDELEEISVAADDDDGASLFHVDEPKPTVGEAPADPFAKADLDDALGDAWEDIDDIEMVGDTPLAPPVDDDEPVVGEANVDLDALEQALSDLDFDLPDDGEGGEIDLQALESAIEPEAEPEDEAGPMTEIPEDLDEALAALMNEAGDLFGSEVASGDAFGIADKDASQPDPFAIAEKGEDDPFAITDRDDEDPFAISEKGDDDPFAIAELGALDPFAIADKDAVEKGQSPSLREERSSAPAQDDENPFAITDFDTEDIFASSDQDDDPFAITDKGDDDPIAISDEYDPFAITDKDDNKPFGVGDVLVDNLEAYSQQLDETTDSGAASGVDAFAIAEKGDDDPFAIADLELLSEADGDEVTGSFNLDDLDGALQGGAPSRDEPTRTRAAPDDSAPIAVAPPAVVEEITDHTVDVFAVGMGSAAADGNADPFGILDARGGGVVITDDDPTLPDAPIPTGPDGEDEFDFDALFGSEGGDQGDEVDPFGLVDANASERSDDPFGITSTQEDVDPFGLADLDDDFDPFGITDHGEDPNGFAALESPHGANGSAWGTESGTVVEPVAVDASSAKPVQLRMRYDRTEAFITECRKNLSQGGTFVKTDAPLDVGRRCRFEVLAPGLAEAVNLEGEVVWSSKGLDTLSADQQPGMGIKYQFRSPAEQGLLEKLLKQLEQAL